MSSKNDETTANRVTISRKRKAQSTNMVSKRRTRSSSNISPSPSSAHESATLPHEIVEQILSYLRLSDIGSALSVCKLWAAVGERDEMWLRWFEQEYPDEDLCEVKVVKDFLHKDWRWMCMARHHVIKEPRLYTGVGCKRLANNNTYMGDLVDSKPHGKGIRIDQYGSLYYGDFVHSKQCGVGRGITSDNSLWYEGDFKDGHFEGRGCYKFSYGASYYGECKGGRFDGRGIFLFSSGTRYEGEFKRGEFEGKGCLTCVNGSIFDGMFHNGDFQGKAILPKSNPQGTGATTQYQVYNWHITQEIGDFDPQGNRIN